MLILTLTSPLNKIFGEKIVLFQKSLTITMKIAFVSFIEWDFNIETPYQIPLGGSQSAMCYLAEAMAHQGHEIFLFNNTTQTGIFRQVNCFPLNNIPLEVLQSLDVLIILNFAGGGLHLKTLIGTKTKLILWTQHAADQSAMANLNNQAEKDVYDMIVFISEWQRQQFINTFNIPPNKTHILRNAIAPAFEQLFPHNTNILSQKTQPPIIAYTSTPFRGLNILLDVFPRIRENVPGTILKVYSSMKVYQTSTQEDQEEYGDLYRQCQETEGVEYIGSIPQPELAKQLKSITVLAYPNTFAETSCIAVMEAMASGCLIITSQLGALPETTANFGTLIPIHNDNWELYKKHFIDTTIDILKHTEYQEEHLREQIDYINHHNTWKNRATEWINWLSQN